MQDETTTLENKDNKEEPVIDIKSLLEAANSSRFDEAETLLRGKEAFEKADSFFELIKSEPTTEAVSNLDSVPLDSEENSEEKGQSAENNSDDYQQTALSEEDQEGSEATDNIASEVADLEVSNMSEASEIKDLNEKDELQSAEENNASFETVDVIKQVINENSDEINDEDESESNIEESEDYQRGYQDALVEFENTLEVEKKAVADFANTLFAARDDFSSLIEQFLIEKAKEISVDFLGERIDEVPELLVDRVKAVSSEIIENTTHMTLELNEIDASAFIEKSSDLPFQIITTSELARGEFRILAGKSGYFQKISN
jgi:hypothetical protein